MVGEGGRSRAGAVSPNSIRSRILKANFSLALYGQDIGFTQFDPFEDTERIVVSAISPPYTIVSPNSIRSRILKAYPHGFPTKTRRVSPNSIRSRILKGYQWQGGAFRWGEFHPIRSVRGY